MVGDSFSWSTFSWLVVFVVVIGLYANMAFPMLRTIGCFVGIKSICIDRAAKENKGFISTSTKTQEEINQAGSGLANVFDAGSNLAATEVAINVDGGSNLAATEVAINVDGGSNLAATEVVITPAPQTTEVVITPAPQTTEVVITPAPQTTEVVNTPAVGGNYSVVMPVATSTPGVIRSSGSGSNDNYGFDLEGFQAMCYSQGTGFVVEDQGGIFVCHCPGCP